MMMTGIPRHRIGALVAGVFMTVCTGDAGSDRSGEDVVDASRENRPWATGPSVEAVLEAASGDDVFLSYVADVGVDSRGRAYVVDSQEGGIIVLNPDLTFSRIVGREGDGPGEFRYASRVQLLPGDSLVVWDSRLQRSTVFPPGGDEAAYVHAPGTQERIDVAWRLPGSLQYIARSSPVFRPDASDEGRTQVLRFVREEMGRVLDEVFADYPDDEGLVFRRQGMVMVGGHPFGRRSYVEILGGDRIVHATSNALEVRSIDPQCETESAFSYEASPISVTGEELDAAVEEAGDALGSVLREGAPYVWHLLTGLVVDDEERIWLGIRQTEQSLVEWAAFTPDGTHLLSVNLPSETVVHAVRGGRIIGVAEDEVEVPRVLAYRLP